jgi:single-strand DNA-binding protein
MFNNVNLIGYLGSDAESRTTRNNSTLTVLSLATKRTWKNRQTGDRESRTTWHRCVVFGKTAEYAATLTKGTHIQIVGEIQTRDFDGRDGAKKYVTEIRVHRIARLDRMAKVESTEAAAQAAFPTNSASLQAWIEGGRNHALRS